MAATRATRKSAIWEGWGKYKHGRGFIGVCERCDSASVAMAEQYSHVVDFHYVVDLCPRHLLEAWHLERHDAREVFRVEPVWNHWRLRPKPQGPQR